jgi:aminoglycoside 6'-N-acetyltransferase
MVSHAPCSGVVGDPDAQFALVSADLADPAMEQFIVATDGHPFGYLQCYDLHAWPYRGFRPAA